MSSMRRRSSAHGDGSSSGHGNGNSSSNSDSIGGGGGGVAESTEEAFKKLFAAVLDPQTQDNHQRHLALTKNVLYQNECGWKLAELPLVNELLLLLRDKVSDGLRQFAEHLLLAIVLCGRPFVRQKTNEEISNPNLLTDVVPTLAQLLSFEMIEIQIAAAEALRQFAVGACLIRSGKTKSNNAADTQSVKDLRLPTRIFSQNIMEETGTVDLIVGVFHDLFPDDEEQVVSSVSETSYQDTIAASSMPDLERPTSPATSCGDASAEEVGTPPATDRSARISHLLFPLIDLVHELSSHQRCAEVLVVTGALHYVVFVLEGVTSPQDELLPLCLTTLWNVLELCEEKMKSLTRCSSRREMLVQFRLRNATFFLSNEFTCHTLLKIFEILLVQGYRRQDKELRNECVMVLLLLARRHRSLQLFYSTGLTNSLLLYATSSEVSNQARPTAVASAATAIVADYHHYSTNSDEDLEFKQTLWLLLSVLSTDNDDNRNAIVQYRLVEVLLHYATWDGDNESEFRERIASLGPKPTAAQSYTPSQMQLLQITALRVLNNIAPHLLAHMYEIGGHKRLLVFLQDAAGSEEVLTAAWELMMNIAPPVPEVQDELGSLGAVEIALVAFNTPPSRHTYLIRRHAIITCAQLCRHHDSNRRRFWIAHNGVSAVIKFLQFDPSHFVLEENIIIGIVESVRSCIVGSAESELAFINAEGVPKLLDIVEVVPKAIKNQVLATLAEICVNPASIPSYTGWRSDRMLENRQHATANQMLLRIYANEEAIEERTSSAVPTGDGHDSTPLVSSTEVRSSAFWSISNCNGPFVVYQSEEQLPSSPTYRPMSPAFARLKEALRAAQYVTSTTSRKKSILDISDDDYDRLLNLKAKIHAVLENLSFVCDNPERLTSKDQVMLEIAKEYPTFQIGEMWQNVQLNLYAEGHRPIYADALYIRKQIEHAYNIAACTKRAQKEIAYHDEQQHSEREMAFFRSILQQKQQEEQAELFLRANRRQNSTMKLHLDAKQTRLEFMKRQDPTAYAAYEKDERCRIEDPPPIFEEELSSIAQKERELRGRLSTISSVPASARR